MWPKLIDITALLFVGVRLDHVVWFSASSGTVFAAAPVQDRAARSNARTVLQRHLNLKYIAEHDLRSAWHQTFGVDIAGVPELSIRRGLNSGTSPTVDRAPPPDQALGPLRRSDRWCGCPGCSRSFGPDGGKSRNCRKLAGLGLGWLPRSGIVGMNGAGWRDIPGTCNPVVGKGAVPIPRAAEIARLQPPAAAFQLPPERLAHIRDQLSDVFHQPLLRARIHRVPGCRPVGRVDLHDLHVRAVVGTSK